MTYRPFAFTLLAACGAPAASALPDAATVGTLGPPTCQPGEAAFVVAALDAGVTAAVGYPGAWAPPLAISGGAPSTTATGFVDDYNVVGAFWVAADETSHYRRYNVLDGTLGPASGPQRFAPLRGSRIAQLGQILIGQTAAGVEVSWFDPDGFDFSPMPIASPPTLSSELSAARDGANLIIAATRANEIVDQSLINYTSWTAPQPHPGLQALVGGEIPLADPVVVTFADGGAVMFANAAVDGQFTVVASIRKDGTWLPPAPGVPVADRQLAAIATADGEAIVAMSSASTTSPGVDLYRFSRTTGWRPLGALDPEVTPGSAAPISIATGGCGDDALIVYPTTTGAIRAVRVRGDQRSTPSDTGLTSSASGGPWRSGLSVVTRHLQP
jgi:hypothetical protein